MNDAERRNIKGELEQRMTYYEIIIMENRDLAQVAHARVRLGEIIKAYTEYGFNKAPEIRGYVELRPNGCECKYDNLFIHDKRLKG